MKSRFRIAAFVCASLLASAPAIAHAQQKGAPSTLTPPKLVGFVEAAYPADALDAGLEGKVELILVIGTDGGVHSADVAAPAGNGFDDAAIEAAKGFRFDPAVKDGAPIAARIRYVYVFEMKAIAPVTGNLEGRVVSTDGDVPLDGAELAITAPDGTLLRAFTSSAGTFSLSGLPAGSYRIHLSALDHADADSTEDVVAGEATSITYRLDAVESGDVLSFGAVAKVDAPPREVVRRTLDAEVANRMAGTRGDALRSVELLPGVGRPPSGGGMILVRGSSPWDSQVFFEGVPVQGLYHFGGLTSFVNSRLLEQIDLYPGNFSARFGRKNGGVVEVGLRDPKTDRVQGVVDVNPIDGSMLVEGPITETVSFALAGRRSFIDFFLNELMKDEESMTLTTAPVYEDFQAIAAWKPSDRDKVRVVAYRSADRLRFLMKQPDDSDPTVRGGAHQAIEYSRLQTQWSHKYSPELDHEISVTGGTAVVEFNYGEASLALDVVETYGRSEFRWRPSPTVQVIGGLDIERAVFEGTYTGPRAQQGDGNPTQYEPLGSQRGTSIKVDAFDLFRPAAYVETIVNPVERLQVVVGLRADHYADTADTTVLPRANVRLQVARNTSLKAGAGMFSQGPEAGETVKGLGNPDLEPIRAVHYGAGVEQKIGGFTLGTEGFYKDITNTIVNNLDPTGPGIVNGGKGRIYGMELSGRYQGDGRVFGIASYTLSRSERQDQAGEAWRLYDFDQTHNLSLTSGIKLGRGWDLGATARLVSGSPSTPIASSFYNADLDIYQPVYGKVNSSRDPFTRRIDVRIEKGWKVNGRNLAAYVDVQNALNERPPEGRNYNYDYTRSKPAPGLPIIPSVGFRAEL